MDSLAGSLEIGPSVQMTPFETEVMKFKTKKKLIHGIEKWSVILTKLILLSTLFFLLIYIITSGLTLTRATGVVACIGGLLPGPERF